MSTQYLIWLTIHRANGFTSVLISCFLFCENGQVTCDYSLVNIITRSLPTQYFLWRGDLKQCKFYYNYNWTKTFPQHQRKKYLSSCSSETLWSRNNFITTSLWANLATSYHKISYQLLVKSHFFPQKISWFNSHIFFLCFVRYMYLFWFFG